jgi:predicted  nucleic acid-binding Zn-ribbon protein
VDPLSPGTQVPGLFLFPAILMDADLERLIALQKLDSATHDAERRLAAEPGRLKALDEKLDAAKQSVAGAKEKLTANQGARREIEKNVAMHQGRLSKFREQAMAVKTNQEYHAIQNEIGFAQGEIKKLEDQILELMMEADDLTAGVKKSEAALSSEQKAAEAEKQAITREQAELKAALEKLRGERGAVVGALAPATMSLFERVSKKNHGVAMAEARDGICTICHVRLRPQVFNTVRRNEGIVQCDSCQRVLYFVPPPAAAAPPA